MKNKRTSRKYNYPRIAFVSFVNLRCPIELGTAMSAKSVLENLIITASGLVVVSANLTTENFGPFCYFRLC